MLTDPLVVSFERAQLPAQFRHREHLYLAWCYLRALPLEDALARYVRGLRAVAGDKFHRTLTWAWLVRVDDAMSRSPSPGFDELLAAQPSLLDVRALNAHYTSEELASDWARRHFILPRRTT